MSNLSNEDIELASIARALRASFKYYKEKTNKRPYKPDKRFDTVECWKKVAKVVNKLNAVPEEYIRAQFIYSAGTVFANTLHGTVAQNKYKKLKRMAELTSAPSDTPVSTALLAESINQVEGMLQEQFGPSFKLSKETLVNSLVKKEILSSSWRFDPVVIMAYAGDDNDYRQKFLLRACDMVVESPYLIKAAASLGLDLSNMNTDEREFTDN